MAYFAKNSIETIANKESCFFTLYVHLPRFPLDQRTRESLGLLCDIQQGTITP